MKIESIEINVKHHYNKTKLIIINCLNIKFTNKNYML